MKSALLLATFLLWSCISAHAQAEHSLQGVLSDSSAHLALTNASVCILNAKDSTLVTFKRASSSGSFSFPDFKYGKYILLVTYPDYVDYVEHFHLDSTRSKINFGKINMTARARLLGEVIVRAQRTAIKIKGDTTEFNAGSFVIQPNDKVEDLLRQLPGIEVDNQGNITAQGQKVNKVLVDGEEFFGDDPTLVTKNLKANMVDKVQLYDKKSDQSTFTGIDDGKKEKTINIKLREDKKNGFFGKVEVGGGTKGYYQEQVMFNAFKAKQKLSIYGTLANTGKISLGFEEANKYGSSSSDPIIDDAGNISVTQSTDDLESFDGNYNGQGIPVAKNAGLHYETKFNKDKESINANYKIGSLAVSGFSNSLNQTSLPIGFQSMNSTKNFDNSIFRQKADVTYKLKIDTSSDLKLIVDGTLKTSKTTDAYLTNTKSGNDTLLNQSSRNLKNRVDGQAFHVNAFYTKKFKKVGRTLSVSLDEAFDENKANGNLQSTIQFYDAGILDSVQRINQNKINDLRSSVFKSNIAYTEPLSKKVRIILNYGFLYNSSFADRRTFDSTSAGQYQRLDTALSNSYKFNQVINEAGAILNIAGKKESVNFGTKVATDQYRQIDQFSGSVFSRNFINWNPQVNYTYKFGSQSALRLRYSGETKQPTIDQLQPLIINTDPLNIVIGNQGLRPSFTNQISGNYYMFKVLTEQYVYIDGTYGLTSRGIVSNQTVDSTGKTTSQFVNSSHNSGSLVLNTGIFRKIKPLNMNAGLNFSINENTTYNYVNNVLNLSRSGQYSVMLDLGKYKAKAYQMHLSFGPSYLVSKSSLQSLSNNGFGLDGNFYFAFNLPWKIVIAPDGNYQYRAKTSAVNQDFQRLTLDGRITKSFFKSEELKLSLAGFDLLNQNKGFDRSVSGATLSQTTYTTLKQYFMLSLIWDFSKVGGSASKK